MFSQFLVLENRKVSPKIVIKQGLDFEQSLGAQIYSVNLKCVITAVNSLSFQPFVVNFESSTNRGQDLLFLSYNIALPL